jgi:uncharacterized membrane protein YdjX (TVP38/TMEM64 family)
MTRRRLGIVIGALALIAVFAVVRRSLGLELAPESIRASVDRLGIWGPLAFVTIVALRIPLGVPSAIALIGGGLVFGSVEGTLYGGAGLLISALFVFLGSRWAGRDAVEARVPLRMRPLLDASGSRIGALFLALGTMYPLSPITGFHLLAGVTGMGVAPFVLAAGTGSLGRAAIYTYFGSRLVDADPVELVGAGALFLAMVLLPLALPAPRAWLLRAMARRSSDSKSFNPLYKNPS